MIPNFYERKIADSMRERCTLAVPLELKSLGTNGRFAGYASVFDVVDSQRDVVKRGAFLQTLSGRLSEIKMLWQHKLSEPIGYFTAMFEDSYGLYVEGQLLMDVERAREAYALMKQGVVSGLSIGYAPIRYRRNPDTGVRQLTEVALYEISLVTLPANEQSRISVVKGRAAQADNHGDFCHFSSALDQALVALMS